MKCCYSAVFMPKIICSNVHFGKGLQKRKFTIGINNLYRIWHITLMAEDIVGFPAE